MPGTDSWRRRAKEGVGRARRRGGAKHWQGTDNWPCQRRLRKPAAHVPAICARYAQGAWTQHTKRPDSRAGGSFDCHHQPTSRQLRPPHVSTQGTAIPCLNRNNACDRDAFGRAIASPRSTRHAELPNKIAAATSRERIARLQCSIGPTRHASAGKRNYLSRAAARSKAWWWTSCTTHNHARSSGLLLMVE